MEQRPDVSVKGYYYNLDKSPHVWKSPCGDTFRLPSAKRLELMDKRSQEALRKLDKLIDAHNLREHMPAEIYQLLQRYMIQSVYEGIVGE